MSIKFLSGVNVDSNTLVVDAANDRVGIGTATPSVELAIYQSSTPRLHLQNSTSGTTSTDGLQIALSGVDGYLWNWENGATIFATNNAERMRITAAGNVGIGTTAPAAKLNVVGTTYLGAVPQYLGTGIPVGDNNVILTSSSFGANNNQNGGSNLILAGRYFSGDNGQIQWASVLGAKEGANDGGSAGYMALYTNPGNSPTERLRITSAGSVGIGTTSPVSLLNLNNGDTFINVTDTLRGLQFGYAGPSHGSYRAAVMGGAESYGGTDSGMLTFHTQNGYVVSAIPPERMRITSAGNVGIGTTSPANTLDIAAAQATLRLQSTTGTNTVFAKLENTAGTFYIARDNSAGSSFGVANAAFLYETGANPIVFFTNSAERMRLHASGNLSIGNTTDVYKLDVSGSAYISNTATIVGGGNTLLLLKGTGSAAIAFGGTSDQASALIEGISGGGLNVYTSNGGTFTTPNWASRFQIAAAGAATFTSSVTASSLIKSGGTASQYLMADGSVSTLTNPVTGTGTTNYVPKFTSASAIGNSQIFDNGTNVGIGTAIPSQKLQVTGAIEAGPSSTSGGAMIYQTYNSPSYIGSIGSEYSSGAMLIGYGATGKSGASGYVSTFDNFSGTRGLISLAGGNFSILSSISAVNTAVGGDLTMTTNLVVTAAGNVGIGTTSPAAALHVQSASTKLFLSNTDFVSGTTGSGLILTTGASSGQTYSQIWAFQTGNTAYANLVVPGGNVGIGTTAPGYKLEVNGGPINIINGYSEPSSETGYRLKFADNGGITNDSGIGLSGSLGDESLWINKGSANGNIRFMFGTLGEKVTFTSAGNVGIGTTAPSGKLQVGTYGTVGAPTYSTANGDGLIFDFFNSGAPYTRFGRIVSSAGDASEARLSFFTKDSSANPTEKVTILGNGNVGIGTDSPVQKLQVSGSVALNTATDGSSRYFTYPDANHSWYYDDNIVGSSADVMTYYENFLVRHQDTTNVFLINGSGNVGIGTTSPAFTSGDGLEIQRSSATATLRLDSGVFATELRAYTDGTFLGQLSNSYLDLGTNNSTKVRITGDGNVGIGTTSPNGKLTIDTGPSNIPTLTLNSLVSSQYYGNVNCYDPYHGMILRGIPAAATDYTVTAQDSMSFYEYGSDFRFYKKRSTPVLQLDAQIFEGEGRFRGDVVAYYSFSDERLKDEVKPLENSLDKVLAMQGVSYKWNSGERKGQSDIGLIAQQVEKVVPEVVREKTNIDGDTYKSVNYEHLVGILIEAIKEQQQQIDELKKLIK
jgi:hypothetical protein